MKTRSQSNLPNTSYERVVVEMPCTLNVSRFLVVLAATNSCFGLTLPALSSPLIIESVMRPAPTKPMRAPDTSATLERLPDLARLGLVSTFEPVDEARCFPELLDLEAFT